METTLRQPSTDSDTEAHVGAPVPAHRGWTAAAAAAGGLFLLYPVVRPFADEASLEGAAAFASTEWLVAHTAAMAAFALLTLGLLGLHLRLQPSSVARRSLIGLVLSWLGVTLTLAYYGAETFGLAAIGRHATEQTDPSFVHLVEAVQLGPGIGFLVGGLVLLAAGVSMVAAAIWRSGTPIRWGGLPLAIGVGLYVPQFLAPQPVRIAHGILMLVGCLLLAFVVASIRNVGQPSPRGRAPKV